MSLRERLRASTSSGPDTVADKLYARFGFRENPFPAASQTAGHPRAEDEADQIFADLVKNFEGEGRPSQVVVVEGTQGVGKTNLLNHYEEELRDFYGDRAGFYIIRYYADPQPSFDAIVQSVIQELGVEHLKRLAAAQADQPEMDASDVRSADMRSLFSALKMATAGSDVFDLAHEWLLGGRVLNAHRESLGVIYRLDTVESKTQALRDLVTVSAQLGVLEGVFLLLDELEKHQGVLGQKYVVRFLLALRALIDALPKHLFLVLAMTPSARRDYFTMVPAIATRLQRTIQLSPLTSVERAISLARFYVDHARTRAQAADRSPSPASGTPGTADVLSKEQIKKVFSGLLSASEEQGIKGVLQRDFLHQLHLSAATVLAQ